MSAKVAAVKLGEMIILTTSAELFSENQLEMKKEFPHIPIKRIDERFTSKMAQRTLIDGGVKKKKRQDKALLDSISATIILQSYLEQIN